MRQLVKLSILVLFVLLIAACSDNKEQNETEKEKGIIPSQTPYQFSLNEQEFEIIPFYEEILDYIALMKENPELDNREVYTENVLTPFKDKSSLDYITLGDPLSPSYEIEQLEKNTSELLKNQEQINKWIEEAILESAELLSGEDTTIYVFPVNPEEWFTIDNLEGISGVAYSGNNILLNIDPSVSEEMLKYTVAHEYHHTVNMYYNGEQSMYTVLDSIITEGKADSFASIIYPEASVPWTEPLSVDEETTVLKELSINAGTNDSNIYRDFTHGNSIKKTPRWSNYKIGDQIMESFIENNPDISILEWTEMDAKELVGNSDYYKVLQ